MNDLSKQSFQTALDQAYNIIEQVAAYHDKQDYFYRIILLRSTCIKPWNWFWHVAITLSSEQIRLGQKWFTQSPLGRAATLLHESIHVEQYANGKLNWLNYFFKKKQFEAAGNTIEKEFIELANAVK